MADSGSQRNLALALNSRVRRLLLRRLIASTEPIGPVALAEWTGKPLSVVGYHLGVLSKLEMVVAGEAPPGESAAGRLYSPAGRADAGARALLDETEDEDEAGNLSRER